MKWNLFINKKIIILVIVLFAIILVGRLFLINGNKQEVESNSQTDTSQDSYYFDPELSEVEYNIRLAVENYASQDSSEPNSSRIERLKKYFTSNSRVYEYSQDNLNDVIYKTSASVQTIKIWEPGDDSFSVVATTKIIFYYDGGSYEMDKTYWVLLSKSSNSTYLIDDIEAFSYV